MIISIDAKRAFNKIQYHKSSPESKHKKNIDQYN